MSALIPHDDLRLLAAHLSARKVSDVRCWCEICEAFLAASAAQRLAVASRLAEEYAGRVSGGLSAKTIYRRAKAYREAGWRGLIPARDLAHALGTGRDIASNIPFVSFWQALVGENQRATRPAWTKLLTILRAGQQIPGYGTWRDIWRLEHPDRALPDACPYREGVLLPAGWSLANLQRHKPSKWALRALRTGTLAAANLLPSVPRTRAGLSRGQIIEIDDMWHDVKVRFGNARAERCIELAMIDVATGYRTSLMKPIRRRDDNTRELIMPRMMPYVIGYWLVVQGYRAEGALICGEHGTAALSDRLRIAVDDVTGGKIKIAAGGLLSKPLAKGLWDGRPRGNFRFKARLEGSHALLHNELADLPGQVGYTRENAPEDLYGKDKEEAALQRVADELASADPTLYEQLRWPYIPYPLYAALADKAIRRMNERTLHDLEGWEAQGFVAGSWRLSPRDAWHDLAELAAMPPAVAEAIRAELAANPDNFRARRLSPAEAWAAREGDVTRAGRWAMPVILGDSLAMTAVCSDRLELAIKDPDVDYAATVAGIVTDETGTDRLLTRGRPYRVWVNPLEPAVAYIAEQTPDKSWRYLGTAPVMQPGHQDDTSSIGKSLGIRARIEALERAAVAPLVQARAQAKAAADAHNRAVIDAAKAKAKAATLAADPLAEFARTGARPAHDAPPAAEPAYTLDDLI